MMCLPIFYKHSVHLFYPNGRKLQYLDGHGDGTGVEAPEVCGDEIETGRIEEQDTLSEHITVLQPGGDASCLSVEFRIGHDDFVINTVGEVEKCRLIGFCCGSVLHELHQVCRSKKER